jgi:hypothetical protein
MHCIQVFRLVRKAPISLPLPSALAGFFLPRDAQSYRKIKDDVSLETSCFIRKVIQKISTKFDIDANFILVPIRQI